MYIYTHPAYESMNCILCPRSKNSINCPFRCAACKYHQATLVIKIVNNDDYGNRIEFRDGRFFLFQNGFDRLEIKKYYMHVPQYPESCNRIVIRQRSGLDTTTEINAICVRFPM